MFLKKQFFSLLIVLYTATAFCQIDISLEQLDIMDLDTPASPSSIGLLTLSCSPTEAGQFINIVAGDRNNERFWLVRNVYLLFGPDDTAPQFISVRFDFRWLGYEAGVPVKNLDIFVHRSSNILDKIPNGALNINCPVASTDLKYYGIMCSLPPPPPINEPCDVFPVYIADDPVTKVVYTGGDYPNIDLDDARFPDTENYAGDALASGPAAAANMFKWFDFFDPRVNVPAPLRDVMYLFGGKMQRERDKGISVQQFLSGNLEYMQAHGLFLQIRFQSETLHDNIYDSTQSRNALNENSGFFPTWEWMSGQCDGENALVLIYYCWNGEKWLGQAAVLTGLLETANGEKFILIKHDRDQTGQGGTTQEWIGVCPDGFGRLQFRWPQAPHTGIPGECVPCYIGDVISCEYDAAAVPVGLAFFEAVRRDDVYLSWKTCSEIKNYGFDLYRNDEKIAFIPGRGTRTTQFGYTFVDRLPAGGVLKYDLYQIDYDGTRRFLASTNVKAARKEFRLSDNFPNPFNSQTQIRIVVPEMEYIDIAIYDVTGVRIKRIFSGRLPPDEHTFFINLSDQASGVYYYRVRWQHQIFRKKLLFLK